MAAGLAEETLTAVAAIRAEEAAVGLRAVATAVEVTVRLAAVTLIPSELVREREGLSLKVVEGTAEPVEEDEEGSFLRLSLGVRRGLAKDIAALGE